MKSPFLLILITITSVILAACASDPLGPTDSQPIMPLKVGNRWIGRTEQLDTAGEVKSTQFDTLEIVAEEVDNGETWYRTNRNTSYTIREDGLWYRPYGAGDYLMFLAKYPASVDDLFGTDTLSRLPNTDSLVISTIRVRSTGERVTVPAGTFQAIRYVTDLYNIDGSPFDLGNTDEGYVPGVGSVETLYYGRTASGRRIVWMKWQLVEVIIR
jgi:hypothetical protein